MKSEPFQKRFQSSQVRNDISFLLTLMLLLSFMMDWAHAESTTPLFACSFKHSEKPGIEYTTQMDQYGKVLSKGKIGKEPFECVYGIQSFEYLSGAIIPAIRLELKRLDCNSGGKVAQRTRSRSTLTLEKQGSNFQCIQNLMLHFKSGIDLSPKLDSKQLKFYQEKYKKKVWP